MSSPQQPPPQFAAAQNPAPPGAGALPASFGNLQISRGPAPAPATGQAPPPAAPRGLTLQAAPPAFAARPAFPGSPPAPPFVRALTASAAPSSAGRPGRRRSSSLLRLMGLPGRVTSSRLPSAGPLGWPPRLLRRSEALLLQRPRRLPPSEALVLRCHGRLRRSEAPLLRLPRRLSRSVATLGRCHSLLSLVGHRWHSPDSLQQPWQRHPSQCHEFWSPAAAFTAVWWATTVWGSPSRCAAALCSAICTAFTAASFHGTTRC
jgi:hypothetical protein